MALRTVFSSLTFVTLIGAYPARSNGDARQGTSAELLNSPAPTWLGAPDPLCYREVGHQANKGGIMGERRDRDVEKVYVPARAEFNIEHEREGDEEEIEFQLKWTNSS
jgi:hypothetical protein